MSKEITDKIYELFEAANSSGKVKKGTNEVTKAIERGTAKLIAVASDVNPPAIVAHLRPLAEEKGIPYIEVPSKKELGGSVGLKVGCASAGIINEGNARNLFKEVKEAILSKKEDKK